MNAIVPIRPGTDYTGAQLALIKRTVAKDTNADEFDLFMSVARMKGLDPFSRQITAIVFSKDKPDKRQMSIITGIDGMRAIAARSNRYRPDEDEPAFEYRDDAKNPETNPYGIVKATVTIWLADSARDGGWKPVKGWAYWDEFAPIKDEWEWGEKKGERKKTGKQTLDGQWPKMPRIMIAKCAEAQALRKAFPEDLSGLYEGAELDRAQTLEITASEAIGDYETQERLQRIGGGVAGITFQLSPTQALESIPLGKVADRIIDASADYDIGKLRWFESANTHPLREFWARSPGDALAVKKHLEELRVKLAAVKPAEV